MQGTLMILAVLIMLMRGIQSGDAYGAFVRGAKRGMNSAITLMPALCAMTLMLSVMNCSGMMEQVCRLLSPLTRLLGLPAETAPMLALRPLTGSGSLSALKVILDQCGADSRAGRAASVLMGSSETIFYTMTVYLGVTDVKRMPGVLGISLISYLVGAWVCALVV